MGCDIHMFLERKTNSNKYDGPRDLSESRNEKIEQVIPGDENIERWVSADKWEVDEYDKNHLRVSYKNSFYNDRNYYLFGILAGVRYRDVKIIKEPRGIPDDCSYGYKYMAKKWEGDAHSHSYFTLKELLDVDWSIYDDNYIDDFLKSLDRMKEIDPDPNKVRLVFFFDN